MILSIPINDECVAVLQPITEDEPTLRSRLLLVKGERDELAGITHPAQRVEWLACRVAVRELIEAQGMHYQGLQKDEYGKPFLMDLPWHISLSHTAGWAAAVVHRSRPVGIDIEPIREQFKRVVPRVLSSDEIDHAAGDPHRLAMYWCAKEAMYKLYGKRQLTFRDHLHVDPFPPSADHLTGYVRLPDHQEQLTIRCFQSGPGLLAVAY